MLHADTSHILHQCVKSDKTLHVEFNETAKYNFLRARSLDFQQ